MLDQDSDGIHSGIASAVEMARRESNLYKELPPILPADSTEREYARHTWHDSHTGKGEPLVRLVTLGMEVERVRRIKQELIDEGLTPDISNNQVFGALTIRLRGADAKKFRELNPIVPPKFLTMAWQDSKTSDKGEPITRVACAEMSRDDRLQLIFELKSAGFTPLKHKSETLGPTIRLQGEDALRLREMRVAALKPS